MFAAGYETTAMEWTYRISAEARPRVLGRIAQVFEQQMVPLRAFHMVTVAGLHEIAVTVDLDAELARRIHAKLWKQVDVVHVELREGAAAGGERVGIARAAE